LGRSVTPGLKRKILSQTGRVDGVTVIAEVEIEPGVMAGRHTHPGIESGYIVAGEIELPVQGVPTRSLKAGDGFQIPSNTPHAGVKNGVQLTKVVRTYAVEKGKPLASPA
jgi:quercetin dioxygenase-like cupin family protein